MVWVQTLFQWIDLVWIPVALVCLHQEQRLKTVIFIIACAGMMRLQVQLMESIGYAKGFFHWINAPLMTRGLIVYSAFIFLFLLMAHYSPRTNGFIFMAAAITVFMAAFCVSSVIMVL